MCQVLDLAMTGYSAHGGSRTDVQPVRFYVYIIKSQPADINCFAYPDHVARIDQQIRAACDNTASFLCE